MSLLKKISVGDDIVAQCLCVEELTLRNLRWSKDNASAKPNSRVLKQAVIKGLVDWSVADGDFATKGLTAIGLGILGIRGLPDSGMETVADVSDGKLRYRTHIMG